MQGHRKSNKLRWSDLQSMRREQIKENNSFISEDRDWGAQLKSRRFRKLRLSLTGECNFKCRYCGGGEKARTGGFPLQYTHASTFVDRVKAIHSINPLRQVHLTGGEPLVYPYLSELIRSLKELKIESVAMTTNGSLLGRWLDSLVDSGLDSMNVSLDSLDPEGFKKITGSARLDQIIQGIDAAVAKGVRVKINAAIVRGFNEDQIVPLLEFAKERSIRIRYIELMEAGPAKELFETGFVSQEEILHTIGRVYPPGSPKERDHFAARYFCLEDGYEFGIIANTSDPFCSTCDRLRMDHTGNLYGCLNSREARSMLDRSGKPLSSLELSSLLQRSMLDKQKDRFSGRTESLQFIGG